MGNTCKTMAVSFQCMTKFTTNKKKRKRKTNKQTKKTKQKTNKQTKRNGIQRNEEF